MFIYWSREIIFEVLQPMWSR